jgi:hypothetical protein
MICGNSFFGALLSTCADAPARKARWISMSPLEVVTMMILACGNWLRIAVSASVPLVPESLIHQDETGPYVTMLPQRLTRVDATSKVSCIFLTDADSYRTATFRVQRNACHPLDWLLAQKTTNLNRGTERETEKPYRGE